MTISPHNDKYLISVIIAVKNGALSLQRCLDSIAGQSLAEKEIIIIDGASHDGTVEIIKANAGSISYWESEADRGISHAWNKGVAKAKGKWIIFLGSDDYLHDPGVFRQFSKQIAAARTDSRIIYGQVNLVTGSGQIISTSGTNWQTIKPSFLREKMMIPHQACFHHYSLFKEFGDYDESFKIVADYEYLLRIVRSEEPIFIANFIVTDMLFGGVSSQVSNLLTMQKECDRALKKNGFKPTGIKRFVNILVYNILNLIEICIGKGTAAIILDKIRICRGQKAIWTKK